MFSRVRGWMSGLVAAAFEWRGLGLVNEGVDAERRGDFEAAEAAYAEVLKCLSEEEYPGLVSGMRMGLVRVRYAQARGPAEVLMEDLGLSPLQQHALVHAVEPSWQEGLELRRGCLEAHMEDPRWASLPASCRVDDQVLMAFWRGVGHEEWQVLSDRLLEELPLEEWSSWSRITVASALGWTAILDAEDPPPGLVRY